VTPCRSPTIHHRLSRRQKPRRLHRIRPPVSVIVWAAGFSHMGQTPVCITSLILRHGASRRTVAHGRFKALPMHRPVAPSEHEGRWLRTHRDDESVLRAELHAGGASAVIDDRSACRSCR
jgi:hypothetical protein